MDSIYPIWKITSFADYKNNWTSIAGEFSVLTDYQKSLGYRTPEEFFQKQVHAVQTLVNDRVGNILDRIFWTTELKDPIKNQLKKFTYHAIDFLRMNDLAISEEDRLNTIASNKNKPSTDISTDKIEQFVGEMAWRSWVLANIQDLYISWTAKAWLG